MEFLSYEAKVGKLDLSEIVDEEEEEKYFGAESDPRGFGDHFWSASSSVTESSSTDEWVKSMKKSQRRSIIQRPRIKTIEKNNTWIFRMAGKYMGFLHIDFDAKTKSPTTDELESTTDEPSTSPTQQQLSSPERPKSESEESQPTPRRLPTFADVEKVDSLLKKKNISRARLLHPLFGRGFEKRLQIEVSSQGLVLTDPSQNNEMVMDQPLFKVAYITTIEKKIYIVTRRTGKPNRYRCHGFALNNKATAREGTRGISQLANDAYIQHRKQNKPLQDIINQNTNTETVDHNTGSTVQPHRPSVIVTNPRFANVPGSGLFDKGNKLPTAVLKEYLTILPSDSISRKNISPTCRLLPIPGADEDEDMLPISNALLPIIDTLEEEDEEYDEDEVAVHEEDEEDEEDEGLEVDAGSNCDDDDEHHDKKSVHQSAITILNHEYLDVGPDSHQPIQYRLQTVNTPNIFVTTTSTSSDFRDTVYAAADGFLSATKQMPIVPTNNDFFRLSRILSEKKKVVPKWGFF